MITQDEINVSLQKYRNLYCKIQLFSFNFSCLGEMKGNMLSAPTFSIDSSSDIRRKCNLSFTPINSDFEVVEGSKIWMDKYIKVYMGIENIHTKEIVYTNMGVYLINNPSSTYSATDNTVTIEGTDLMARLNGNRGGNTTGIVLA